MIGYNWKSCENFDIPDNTIHCGNDDDGYDIYCGKTWYDGREVPAKIVPKKRECRVQCGSGECLVPQCSKVLISEVIGDHCRPKHHCHDRCEENCFQPAGECNVEEITTTKTESNNKNECKTFMRTVRVNSSICTTTVKKEKYREECRPKCWTEERTRMVPKVTYEKKIRYEPKVDVEKTVQYVPETYRATVCANNTCCKPCVPRRPEPCPCPKPTPYQECSPEPSVQSVITEEEEIVIQPKKF